MRWILTIPLRSDNRNDTHFEYVSSANWHTSSSSSEDNPLTQFTSKEAVLLPHDIYMEHYKEQLTTCVFSSTVEPSNITHFVQQYSRIHKIYNSIDISNQRYSWSYITYLTVQLNNIFNTLNTVSTWHQHLALVDNGPGREKSWWSRHGNIHF